MYLNFPALSITTVVPSNVVTLHKSYFLILNTLRRLWLFMLNIIFL